MSNNQYKFEEEKNWLRNIHFQIGTQFKDLATGHASFFHHLA
jgi:hypothetical protein